MMPGKNEDRAKIIELLREGLTTDGAHHKQWFLEEILGILSPKDVLEGRKYDLWEKGIPP